MPPHKNLDPYTSPRAFYGAELRRLREEAGLTQEGLGERAFCSGAYIGQFETGARRPQMEISQCFDNVLGSGEHLQRLCRLARQSRHAEYFADVAELETTATSYCEYSAMLIPGFLQTEAYARAIHRAHSPLAPEEKIETLVSARMARADRLLGSADPMLWVIVHEAALRLEVGSAAIAREQLAHIYGLASKRQIALQVQPFSSGPHPSMTGTLLLLSSEEAPQIAYAEGAFTGQLIDEPALVKQYRESYDLARAAALPLSASLDFVNLAAEDFHSP